jgi:hypothetical protein
VRASLDPRCVLDLGGRRLLDRVHATRAHPARRSARRRPQARPALADRGLGTRGARVISRGWRRYGSCDGRGRAHRPARRLARGRGRRARLLRLLVVGGADGKRWQRRGRQRRRRLVAGGGSRRRARRRRRNAGGHGRHARRRRCRQRARARHARGLVDARPGQLQRLERSRAPAPRLQRDDVHPAAGQVPHLRGAVRVPAHRHEVSHAPRHRRHHERRHPRQGSSAASRSSPRTRTRTAITSPPTAASADRPE